LNFEIKEEFFFLPESFLASSSIEKSAPACFAFSSESTTMLLFILVIEPLRDPGLEPTLEAQRDSERSWYSSISFTSFLRAFCAAFLRSAPFIRLLARPTVESPVIAEWSEPIVRDDSGLSEAETQLGLKNRAKEARNKRLTSHTMFCPYMLL
jgi:hypothetical protein